MDNQIETSATLIPETFKTEIIITVFDAVTSALQLNGLSAGKTQEPKKRVLVNMKRAMEITGLAEKTIYMLKAKGGIPCVKSPANGRLYFYESDLVEWLTGESATDQN